jgi:hypothetical protein
VNLASGPFYTSGTFWTAVGIPVAILIGVATVLGGFRAANPNRRLWYWLLSDTPLLTRKYLSEELKVTYGMQELKSPRVMNVQLASRGRRDISPGDFNGKPVCLDLASHIVECLNVTTWPSDRSDPAWTMEGSKLLIGPDLFGKRQKTVFSLLTDDGEPPWPPVPPTYPSKQSPRIVPPMQSMIDVRIERGDGGSPFRYAAPFLWFGIAWIGFTGLLAVWRPAYTTVPAVLFEFSLLALILGGVLWGERQRRRGN